MAWKIFAVFVICFGIIGTVSSVQSGATDVLDLIGLLLFPLSAIGLYGYAFGKPIFNRSLWRPFAWIFGLWSIASTAIAVWRTIPSFGDADSMAVVAGLATGIVLGSALAFFTWLALWRYAGGHHRGAANGAS